MKETEKGLGNTTIGFRYRPGYVPDRLMRALTIVHGDSSMTYKWINRDALLTRAGMSETDKGWQQALYHLRIGKHIERRIEGVGKSRVESYRRITPVSDEYP